MSVSNKDKKEDPVLLAKKSRKSMDGPVVRWTPFDLVASLSSNPRVPLAYHVVAAGYDYLTPIGAIVGGGLYATNLWRPAMTPSVWAMMGTSGLVGGGLGSVLGLAGMVAASRKSGDSDHRLPWTEDGIQSRVDGLRHNFMVRVMDLSGWAGIGLAAGIVLLRGGPSALRLSKGPLGTLQALSLGSTIGSLSAFTCIFANKRQQMKDLEDD